MEREDLIAIVKPHAHRLLRRFVVAPDPGNHSDSRVDDAFWDLVYWGIEEVDHATAAELERELMNCDRKVGELIFGDFRPEALKRFDGGANGNASE